MPSIQELKNFRDFLDGCIKKAEADQSHAHTNVGNCAAAARANLYRVIPAQPNEYYGIRWNGLTIERALTFATPECCDTGHVFNTREQAEIEAARRRAHYYLACLLDDIYILKMPHQKAGFVKDHDAENYVPVIMYNNSGDPVATATNTHMVCAPDNLYSSKKFWVSLLILDEVEAAVFDLHGHPRPDRLKDLTY